MVHLSTKQPQNQIILSIFLEWEHVMFDLKMVKIFNLNVAVTLEQSALLLFWTVLQVCNGKSSQASSNKQHSYLHIQHIAKL